MKSLAFLVGVLISAIMIVAIDRSINFPRSEMIRSLILMSQVEKLDASFAPEALVPQDVYLSFESPKKIDTKEFFQSFDIPVIKEAHLEKNFHQNDLSIGRIRAIIP